MSRSCATYRISLLIFATLAACSKSDPPRQAANLTTQDVDFGHCSNECRKLYPKGADKLVPLDDCVATKCGVPTDEDNARTQDENAKACAVFGGGGAKEQAERNEVERGGDAASSPRHVQGTRMKKLTYAYAPTDACMARACCAEASACAGSECLQLVACVNECNGSQ